MTAAGNVSPHIYVITHKECRMPELDHYEPLLVGANKNEAPYNNKDNTGENISNLNESFCELTGQYWVWKNLKSEISGFVHYRRFFYSKEFSKSSSDIVNASKFCLDLTENDIVLPTRSIFTETVFNEFCKYHFESDLWILRNTIRDIFPNYIHDFDLIMQSREMYAYNMFVAGWDVLDAYFDWLFKILFQMQGRTDISEYDTYNRRLYGFLAERLLNVWVMHNSLKVKEYPVFRDDENVVLTQIKNIGKRFLISL